MNAVLTSNALRAVAPAATSKSRARASRSSAFAAGSVKVSASKATAAPRGLFAARVVSASAAKEDKTVDAGRLALLATAVSNPILFGAQEALAKGGEFGILEGRTAALIHPFFLGGIGSPLSTPATSASSGAASAPPRKRSPPSRRPSR